MSSIPQNHCDENELIDCVQRFFSRHHVSKLLARCNGMKEKGVSPVSLLRYKLSNVFVGRSMYMQQRTGSFKEGFSKNTFYRFLNSVLFIPLDTWGIHLTIRSNSRKNFRNRLHESEYIYLPYCDNPRSTLLQESGKESLPAA